jgi:hypothetical protein
MVTCMETWIVADLDSVRAHFGSGFKPSKLPALHDLEKSAIRAIYLRR